MIFTKYKIALVGNPNSGKSSLFNALTGLNQKVGNFPGVTVDRKSGYCRLTDSIDVTIIDLPGTYSIYPKSIDEKVTHDLLLNKDHEDRPDLIIVVADASNLKRNLLFCSQIMDLRIPVVVALTMQDIARQKGISIDLSGLERLMGVSVVGINPRRNKGLAALRKKVEISLQHLSRSVHPEFVAVSDLTGEWIEDVRLISDATSDYAALHVACHYMDLAHLSAAQRIQIAAILDVNHFQKGRVQAEEIMQRYQMIGRILQQCLIEENPLQKQLFSERLDKALLHPLWGNAILLVILFMFFQSIFWLAQYPMGWIESFFAWGSLSLQHMLPSRWWSDLLVNGILAGMSGIAVFVPQIMILFGFITILEDSGYMARISFLTDRIMRGVGLNGRSVMPLVSGMACAVPAIMAARTIPSSKERLITIMVTPLMSCSARLPVYTILINLIIPDSNIWVFSLRGCVLMGLYILGFLGTLAVAWVMQHVVSVRERTFYLMELPVYRAPRWRSVTATMVEKGKLFVRDAGKVILIISLILWTLSHYGPVRSTGTYSEHKKVNFSQQALGLMTPTSIEQSYIGIIGQAIEPVIAPLGFDWKIGVALITSFAAREVFVATMATLYSVNDATQEQTLREKMAHARRADGTPVYTLATGLSLLLFYVFAMQCMSTLAVVRKETRSWKYPLIQFCYMLALAFGSALVVFQAFK